MSLIGNVDTPESYVADYMQACVGMFGIPAGGFTSDIETFGSATSYDVESLYAAMLNSTIGRSIYAPGISNESFATKLVDKVGGGLLSDANKAAAIDEVQALLDGGLSRAATAMAVVEFVAGLETSDETYGAVAQQFQNRIEIANYYTFSSTNPSSTLSTLTAVLSGVSNTTDVSDPEDYLDSVTDPGVSTGQTFTLTTSIDNITGTSGNDTIIGDAGSISAADNVAGGSGTDTLKLVGLGNATYTLTASSVENLTLGSSHDSAVFNANAASTGLEKLTNFQSSNSLEVTNLKANAAVELDSVAASKTTKLGFASGVLGTTAAANVTAAAAGAFSGAAHTLEIDTAGTSTDVVKTLNITTKTANSNLAIASTGAGEVALTKVTFAGDKAVKLADGTNNPLTNVTEVDGAAMTAGGFQINLANNTKDVKVTGSAGDDKVTFAAGQFNTLDVIDLGAGTKDIIVVGESLLNDKTSNWNKALIAAKNVEIVGTSVANTAAAAAGAANNAGNGAAGTAATGLFIVDASNFSMTGYQTTVAITGQAGGAGGASTGGNGNGGAGGAGGAAVAMTSLDTTVIYVDASVTGGIGGAGGAADGTGTGGAGGAGAAAITVAAKTGSGSDKVSLFFNEAATITGGAGGAGGDSAGSGGTAGNGGAGAAALDASGIEVIAIETAKAGANVTFAGGAGGAAGAANGGTAGAAGAAATNIVLVGANATITLKGAGDVNLGKVVSAAGDNTTTGNLTINAADMSGALTVVTGAGNDKITAGSKGDTITAGAGADQVTAGAGKDTFKFIGSDSTKTEMDTYTNVAFGGSDKFVAATAGSNSANIKTATTTQASDISGQASLSAAIDYVFLNVINGANNAAKFTYGGTEYLAYNAAGTDITNANDFVVKLVGATGTLTAGDVVY